MPLYPSGRRDLFGLNPAQSTHPSYRQLVGFSWRRINVFVNDEIERTSSYPNGYAPHGALIQPIRTGGIAAVPATLTLDGTAELIKGGPIDGSASISLTADNQNLSLVVGMDGSTTISVTADGMVLALTIGMDGTGTITLSGDTSNLGMIVPAEGSASFSITGDANLKGLLSLEGESTPFTELSPQNLAESVWNQIIENGYSATEAMRILLAIAAGKTNIIDLGGGDATVEFRNLADTLNRVSADMTGSERTDVTLNVS
jgi:hypothetical protein